MHYEIIELILKHAKRQSIWAAGVPGVSSWIFWTVTNLLETVFKKVAWLQMSTERAGDAREHHYLNLV